MADLMRHYGKEVETVFGIAVAIGHVPAFGLIQPHCSSLDPSLALRTYEIATTQRQRSAWAADAASAARSPTPIVMICESGP